MEESDFFIRINNRNTNYLNHGSHFSLDYSIPQKFKKSLIFYKQPISFQNYHKSRTAKPSTLVFWNVYRFFRFLHFTKNNKGSLNLIANYYFPNITIYFIERFFPLKYIKRSLELKIDFVNALHYNFNVSGSAIKVLPNLPIPNFNQRFEYKRTEIELRQEKLNLEIQKFNPKISNNHITINKKILQYE